MRKNQGFYILFLAVACFLIGRPSEAIAAGFEQDLTSGGIAFHVVSVNDGAGCRVKITLSGPGVDPGPVESRVDGSVTWAEVTDDLDNDGSPELYVYATCPEEVTNDVGHDPYSVPPGAAVVTAGPHADHNDHAAVVVASGRESSSAVVVGPVVAARTDGGIVRVFPIIPVESKGHQKCIRELKFVLVTTPKGKALKLEHSR